MTIQRVVPKNLVSYPSRLPPPIAI
jgi:hypothetical protein